MGVDRGRRMAVLASWMAVASVGGGCDDEPEPLGELAAVEVTAAARHTCARFASGAVGCWGTGTLGDGIACADRPCSAEPVLVRDLADAVSVSAGLEHTCAVRATGDVVCWGLSTWGDDALVGSHETPQAVPGISNAVAVSSATMGACARLATGEVVCWGQAWEGRLGDGEDTHEPCHPMGLFCSRTPVPVVGLTDAVGVSVGNDSACAIRRTGGVVCWGHDVHPIDDASWIHETHTVPVEVGGVSDAIAVSAEDRACALTDSGTVTCWTAFDDDPPSGSPTMPGTPQDVPGLTSVADLDIGHGHSCAVHETGRVSCWGLNNTGQVGDGGTSANVPDPVAVLDLDDAVAVSAGYGHSCAVRASGRIACWGSNADGQLGDGTTVGQFEPVDVAWP